MYSFEMPKEGQSLTKTGDSILLNDGFVHQPSNMKVSTTPYCIYTYIHTYTKALTYMHVHFRKASAPKDQLLFRVNVVRTADLQLWRESGALP